MDKPLKFSRSPPPVAVTPSRAATCPPVMLSPEPITSIWSTAPGVWLVVATVIH